MTILLWSIAIVGGLLAAWFLFKGLLGFLVPPEVSGRAYLRQALNKRGIGPEQITDACVFEFVHFTEKTSRVDVLRGKKFTTSFAEGLDLMADIIGLWLRDPKDKMFDDLAGTPNAYKEILERHAVRKPAASPPPIKREPSGYYDWMHGPHTCPQCGWVGVGRETKMGESFEDGSDRHCPTCKHRFGYVAYPFLEESINDPRAPRENKLFADIALRGAKEGKK